MKAKFKTMLYGGDYNPEQWPREVWQQDMELFEKAHLNSATVNVFSWARIQPSEETYDFSELDDIVDTLTKSGKQIVLATATAALPAWMVKRYPQVARVDYEGRRHKFGQRHNACPNSPMYQHFVAELTARLAQRYGKNENVVCWHINNEYGGESHCENCEKAFRVWLRKKYSTIAALNRAWNLAFWGHTIYEWDEVVLPNALSEGISRPDGEEPGSERTAFAGMSIDYRRFMSDSLLNNFRLERDTIRQYDQDTIITTNLMGTYKGLDYFRWAKEMDIVSWDNYPSYDTPWSLTAMRHDLMRGLKGAPFMLMEQTPSQQNWQPYNSLKKPGQMRAQSWQTVAHGADTVQFFQLRRSVGGCEKFHGAVIAHAGSDQTRVFREVAQLGEELERIGDTIIGSRTEAKAAIIFDWDNYWALEYTSGPNQDLKYVDQILRYYEYFYRKNISVDLIPVDGDFSSYDLVVAPVLYMVKEGMQEELESFVAAGGVFVTGFMSGIVNESDNVHLGGYPGPLRALAGIWAEEIDALAPEQSNVVLFHDGTSSPCAMLCDLIHLEGAEAVAHYGQDFYAGMPALTRNHFGKGEVYYIGTVLAEEGLKQALDLACKEARIASVLEEETELEVTRRISEQTAIYFVINLKERALPLPKVFAGKQDLLTGRTAEEGEMLQKYDVRIFLEQNA